ncbi:MAG: hypothetical protein ACRC46_01940 [Thermoguttaceae bacterium]
MTTSESRGSETVWKEDDLAQIDYRIWMASDHKVVSVLMLLATMVLVGIVVETAPSVHIVLAILFLLAAISWWYFVPFSVSITHDGIERRILGRRQLILWQEIKSYQCFQDGVSITPTIDRYPLLPLRSTFIPVPRRMMDELRYRLRFFVDRDVA